MKNKLDEFPYFLEDEPCEFPTGEKGVCKRLSDCPSALEQVKVLRRHDKRRCGFFRNEEVVCCNEITSDVISKAAGEPSENVWDEENQTNGATADKNSLPMKSQRKSEIGAFYLSKYYKVTIPVADTGPVTDTS